MIQVSKDSWHYRMATKYLCDLAPSRSLCGYVWNVLVGLWTFVFMTTILGGVSIGALLGAYSLFDGSFDIKYNPFSTMLVLAVGGAVIITSFGVYIERRHTFAQTSAGKIWDGIKKKYCPTLDFKE